MKHDLVFKAWGIMILGHEVCEAWGAYEAYETYEVYFAWCSGEAWSPCEAWV